MPEMRKKLDHDFRAGAVRIVARCCAAHHNCCTTEFSLA